MHSADYPIKKIKYLAYQVYNYLFVNRKNNQYIQTKEFKEDVHHLMTLCLEYNRINQSK